MKGRELENHGYRQFWRNIETILGLTKSPVNKKNDFGKDVKLEGIIRGERGASAPSEREGG